MALSQGLTSELRDLWCKTGAKCLGETDPRPWAWRQGLAVQGSLLDPSLEQAPLKACSSGPLTQLVTVTVFWPAQLFLLLNVRAFVTEKAS